MYAYCRLAGCFVPCHLCSYYKLDANAWTDLDKIQARKCACPYYYTLHAKCKSPFFKVRYQTNGHQIPLHYPLHDFYEPHVAQSQ